MKILMVIPTFTPVVGGAERQLEGVAPLLVDLGCEVTIVTRRLPGTSAVDHVHGYRVRRLPTGGVRFGFHVALALYLLFKGRSFGLFHCHTLSGPAAVCSVLGAILRRPVLLKITRSGPSSQIHAWLSSPVRRFAFRLLRAGRTFFVAISSDTLSELRAAGVSDGRLRYIPNGVAVPPRRERRASENIEILFAGRLIQRKRADLLLRAFAAMAERPGKRVRLTIIGAGPAYDGLRQLAGDRGIARHVEFSGGLGRKEVLLNLERGDIFVQPSSSEGMSNALLEAMAAGLAVICSNIAANRDLIEHGVTGLLFDDEAGLTSLMTELAGDADLRDGLARRAHALVASQFSFEAIATRYRDSYQSILGEDL